MLCGYKIWYHKPIYLEAERHTVWSDGNIIRELTFNSDGEENILFIPDTKKKKNDFYSNVRRIRKPIHIKVLIAVNALEHFENSRNYEQMSNEESWNSMVSYEEWLQGKRQPSLMMKIK